MSIVVSDTSPIRVLVHLDMMQVLADSFDCILIPPAVLAELQRASPNIAAIPASVVQMLTVQAPKDQLRIAQLRRRLDEGESEAIALALEVACDAILIDEATGRRVARELGLPTVGALGILLVAKRRGVVRSIRPLLDRLQQEIGFHVSTQLRRDVLMEAGESDE